MVVGEVNHETDVVVVGGGPGGYVAAIRAAELGLAVTLVERGSALGGVCLHEGCMPMRTLHAASLLAAQARAGEAIGVRTSSVEVDMSVFRAWSDGVIEKLSKGVAMLLERHGVAVVKGDGVPASHNRVAVAASHGSERYTARRGVIVATGATPITIGPLRPDGERVLTAAGALALDRLPRTVAVVGGDYIAFQLAVALRRLGAGVVLLGAGHHLLPEIDASLTPLALRGLKRLGVSWRPDGHPLELTETGLRVASRPDGEGSDDVAAEVVILSGAERTPRTADLDLDFIGVHLHSAGFVLVDEAQQTSTKGVYAVGDVTPGAALAARAYRQGKVAADVIAGRPAAFDPAAIPFVVLGEPDLASVGLGETAAREAGYDVATSRFPWSASGAALAGRTEHGQTLVVSERGSGVVLGVHIAGAGASELIGEAALALEMGATGEDLAATIHPHPTLSEGIAEASELALGLPTHVLRALAP